MKLPLNIHYAFMDMLHSATGRYLPHSALVLHHAETTASASHLEAHFQVALHLHVVQFITTGRRCYVIFSPSHLRLKRGDSVCRLQGNKAKGCMLEE